MGFGTDMRGGASHEVLVRVQDSEIRLLDMLQHLITMRVENDRKYAAGLGKMLHASHKVDESEFKECCSIFKAWSVILKETDALMRAIKGNADHLATSTMDVLNQLINDKKAARKKYMEERHRLHSDFAKVQEESSRLHSDYVKSVERLQVDKAKLTDLQAKGKAGPKVDEAKNKYCRSVVRLHKLHNDYILSINSAKEHQVLLRESALPAILDCHQETQEALVHKTKYVLDDFVNHTDLCSADFQSMSQNVKDAVANIQAGSEYSTAFVELFKSSYIPPLEFPFDKKALAEYQGSLNADVIEVNDVTVENLRKKLDEMTEEVNRVKTKITENDADHSRTSVEVNQLAAALVEECTFDDIKGYLDKKNQCDNYNRELQENEGLRKKLEKLIEIVKDPLTQLGDKAAPTAIDMQDIAENPETASISTTNTNSSISSTTAKDTKIMKSLSKMNPFAKKGGKSGSSSSQNNNEDDERDSTASIDDGHNHSITDGKADVRKKPSHSYERSEQFYDPKGAGRNSMMEMREHGQLMDLDHNKAKERIADEEWFHGVLPREEVQRRLVKDGDYLVRESKNKRTNETQFVLSVFWQGHRHFIIQFAPDRGWHFEGQAYPTIQELVRRQYESGLPVTTKSGAILRSAILREWELLNDDIELQMKIGTGNFGEVYKGVYKKSVEVAVKTCKDTLTEDQKITFLQEGRILKQYDHPNIVRYVGIAAQKQPVMIVMEFIPKGSLLQFLKSHGSTQTVPNFVQMCVDAASGMEYLEGRGCIHRDLAARNCLVGENNTIKISDFGMSREEEEYVVSTGMKQIPVKWTAPEALNFGKYTSLCDVWSFGVLMWEIFSCGRSPYTGMTNARAKEWIEQGHRLDSPANTPKSVYQLMLKCWSYNDFDRPHFNEVHNTLLTITESL